MHVEVFSLCDAATVDAGGKLNILGAFDTIWAVELPVVYPQFAVALRVRFESIERGEHKVAFNFIDMDGKHILPAANGVININFQDGQRSASANSIINVQRVKLENYGEYAIDIAIDGRKEASLPLFVMRRPA
ncbi:MAG: hypothetical protein HQL15_07250 [Candidatus Omnitrophica bacterium]|nr:hypothetical protein [Candidatus Omnitrophota bacterium]